MLLVFLSISVGALFLLVVGGVFLYIFVVIDNSEVVVRLLSISEKVVLVNKHVHFVNKNAVCWDSVASLEKNDISNDDVVEGDGSGGAALASDNFSAFLSNLSLEFKELFVFTVVAGCSDDSQENNSEVDRDTLEPLVGILVIRIQNSDGE